MHLRIVLCALVALAAYATPIVAPNPKSVNKLMPKNDEVDFPKNFDVVRSKRAARDSWEDADATSRMDEFRRAMSLLEKFLNSERLTKAKNMSGTMSEMIKLVLRFLDLMESHLNDNHIDHSSE
ncbi:uncharacterized protein LOC111051679 [Nilaparvata lugens]|uniref:uncharacterized protein LOC111051679 n=1 Tax=Nilaparvata lugens TaxID=108931 RepID=UPI000B985522|nr:uncharacterized protein LOC111051679 [Nilaparvata lugens]